MDSNPSTHSSKFVELLHSQQSISFVNYEACHEFSSSQPFFLHTQGTADGGETASDRRERRKWTPADDILLISSCLNTSNDHVVGNEPKSGTFWKRIAAYFAASPRVAGCKEREATHCKQRWHMINDLVCKFCGAYEATTREKASGQNENDAVKHAHTIFYNNYKKKFTLEHAWNELRNDQKWCALMTTKKDVSSKKRKCEDGDDSETSQATENKRPPGVKASKASGKKTVVDEKNLDEFETMWTINSRIWPLKRSCLR